VTPGTCQENLGISEHEICSKNRRFPDVKGEGQKEERKKTPAAFSRFFRQAVREFSIQPVNKDY